MDVAPAVVREDRPLGQDYLAGMALAGRYAYAGREAVARHVVRKTTFCRFPAAAQTRSRMSSGPTGA